MGDDVFLLFKIIWLIVVFVLGTMIGSFLNVCIARLPLEKSVLWPKSRCGACLQPIGRWDNVPVIGYLRLRGRCRTCGATFSSRYMWIELLTGLGFAALFYIEILSGSVSNPYFRDVAWEIDRGVIPLKAWWYWLHHATLLSFLIVAAVCDLDGKIIPLTVTVPGTLIGLLSATLHPWPWPSQPEQAGPALRMESWAEVLRPVEITPGLYPWPVWGPPPDWAPAGSWQLGLMTGLAGALVGSFLMRGVKVVFEGGIRKEALGLGDADLMMMAGAFLGWQPTIVAFFMGAVAALLLVIPMKLLRRDKEALIPFGPGLAIGVIVTWLAWPSLGRPFQMFLFHPVILLILVGVMGGAMFGLSWLMRRPPDEEEPLPGSPAAEQKV